MNYYDDYRSKLKTPEQAVRCVKSGDWVDYGTNVCFPTLLDKALAARRDELTDVKVRGNLAFGPVRDRGMRPPAGALHLQQLALLRL